MKITGFRLGSASNTLGRGGLQNNITRARIVARGPARVTGSAVELPSLVRWSFLVFAFAIPFESADLAFTSGFLSLTRVLAIPFFATYFLYHNPLMGKPLPKVPQEMWWFLIYVVFNLSVGLTMSEDSTRQFLLRFLSLAQLLVFFWVGSSLLRNQTIARDVLLAYSVGWAILAVGTMLNLPGFSPEVTVVSGAVRITASGYDANNMAISMGVAVLSLIGMYLSRVFKHSTTELLIIGMTLPLLAAIVNSGSRSGAVAFALGFMVYLLPLWRSHRKMVAWTLVGLGMVGVVYLLLADTNFSRRWEQTYYEGSLAGREKISANALEMFIERPLFGWGPGQFRDELGNRTGRIWGQIDPHNLLFHVLLEGGLLGTAPFLIGLWLCLKSAWQSRKGSAGLLPLATLTTLLAGNMAITMLNRKPLWLFLALAIASAKRLPPRPNIETTYRRLTRGRRERFRI